MKNSWVRIGLVLLSFAFLAACSSSPYSRGTGEYVGDKAIATQVKAQLAADKTTKAHEIQVEVYRGNVQLSGFVLSEQSRERAGEIARSVRGVKEVINNILVQIPKQQ
jgi:osmotically-inducible protein OsmY